LWIQRDEELNGVPCSLAGADPTLCVISDYDAYFPEDMLHNQMSMSPADKTITNDFKVIVPIHAALLHKRLEPFEEPLPKEEIKI
jgi:hypothetical protein